MMSECMCCEEATDKGNNIFNNKKNMEEMKKGRITPSWIDSLKEKREGKIKRASKKICENF